MNYGMQLSTSGVLANLYRQDVLTSNLANINTVGFKPQQVFLRQRDAARIEDGLGAAPSEALLERLGAGVQLAPNRLSTAQGELSASSSPTDVAIRGEGFLVVRDQSDSGAEQMRLTRDGRMVVDASGRLVHVSSGLPVMDVSNRAIYVSRESPIQISGDGWIQQGGERVARLQLAAVPDPGSLRPVGAGLMVGTAEAMSSLRPGLGQILQYHVENAAVDPIQAMNQIAGASRAAESNSGMISYADRMMDRAINGLGRVGS